MAQIFVVYADGRGLHNLTDNGDVDECRPFAVTPDGRAAA
jgi:hypothetical protein